MERVNAFFSGRDHVSLYLYGKTAAGIRMIERIVSSMQDEIADQMASANWDEVAEIAEAAAELVKYTKLCRAPEEDSDDETV